jgi:hypothetical protein
MGVVRALVRVVVFTPILVGMVGVANDPPATMAVVIAATSEGTGLVRTLEAASRLPGMPWIAGLSAAIALLGPYLPEVPDLNDE